MTGREITRWRVAYVLLLFAATAAVGMMLYAIHHSDTQARARLKATILVSCERGNTLRSNQRVTLQALITLTEDLKAHADSPQLRRDTARRLPDLRARLAGIQPVDCVNLVE